MDRLLRNFDKFLLPTVLVLLGGALIIYGMTDNQPTLFIFGGVGILLIGIISFLYTFNMLSGKISLLAGVFMLIGAGALAYFDYDSINSVIEFEEEREWRKEHIVQRLKDIRSAEVAYKRRFGNYTADWDSLINFVANDSVMILISKGETPDSVLQWHADSLGMERYDLITMGGLNDSLSLILASMREDFVFVRDTNYIPAFGEVFPQDSATIAERVHPLQLDSLPYIPNLGGREKFEIGAGALEQGGQVIPVFEVREVSPFDPKDEPLQVGSLNEAKTNGNWGE